MNRRFRPSECAGLPFGNDPNGANPVERVSN